MLVNRTLANVPLVVAFLGIAETAMALAVEGCKKAEDTASRPGVANALAVMEILLATSQLLSWAAMAKTSIVFCGKQTAGRT